jgi:single-strand DNA-binding protein
MTSINKVILTGRVGQDPRVASFDNGKVASFTMATSKNYKKDDQWQEKTEWHNIVASGYHAEKVERQCKKGMWCEVEGEITTNKWEKDGKTNYKTEIRVEKINFPEYRSEQSGDLPDFLAG